MAERGPDAPRVRVARTEMEGSLPKEMSEGAVLAKLDKDLAEMERGR